MQERKEVFSYKGWWCINFSHDVVSKLESTEEQRWNWNLIAQGLKGNDKYKQRNNMGEIRKHRSGFSQYRDSLALQREWNMWGSSNSSPWSDNIWTYLAHTKLELVLSLHSLAAASRRFLIPASHSPLLRMFRQALYVTKRRCVWH